jgi:septum formation topological specificity factor MinE
MITLLSFNAKTRKLRLIIARERQRTYFNSVFELRVIIDNINRYIKFHDIKEAKSDDVRDACCEQSFLMFELVE